MLRRRRGSVSTPRSGPSLFGLLVLGSPGGQPKSQKAFWAACLSLCSFRRAAPRAVGSGTRVGLLARPSAAVACWRARAGQPARGFCVWWAFAPARRERRREASLGAATGLAMCGLWSKGVFRFEASVLPEIICSEQCPRLLHVFSTFWVSLNREKHIASKRTPRSTSTLKRCVQHDQQPCSPAPPEP